MAKKDLTDRTIKALKPTGERYIIMDAMVPGFGVRVSEKGKRTFVLYSRFPGSKNPTRRALGEYGELTLEQARTKARDWHGLIRKGVDPADEERRQRDAEKVKRNATFGAVAEEYIARKIKTQRRATISEREIRRELIPVWRDKPITEITKEDVVRLIEAIADRPALYTAHNCFGHVRTLYNWCINRGIYGLETSPCDRLKPATLIGAKEPRQRVLSDNELAAFWRSAERLGYPFGGLFQLLAITGQRKSDVADARWREFDLPNRRWVVPASRFKSGVEHIVPLSGEAMAILEDLPRFNRGDFLFSTAFGEKPVAGFSKAKARLNSYMQQDIEFEPFVLHDLRRTMRTGLASLRVQDNVAEMVIGHGRKGLQRVYDLHSYEPEMREALDSWAARLRNIVTPSPANVVKLADVRA